MRNLDSPIRWLRRMQVMTIKELLQLFRDVTLMLFFVYSFTVDIYTAGSGFSLDLNHAAMVVRDDDRSSASRELVQRFRAPYFQYRGTLNSTAQGLRMLDRGQAMIVLDIPPQFETSITAGRQATVQMQVDTTNSVLGQQASSYGAQIAGEYGLEMGLAQQGLTPESLKEAPVIVDDHRIWFNQNQNDAWFMTISEMLIIITVFALALPAAAMVREKERGTIEQLLVSPLSPIQVMFPKILSMMLVILAGTAVSLFGVLEGIFHVPVKGSLTLFFAVTAVYVFVTAGLGLYVATLARNLAQVGMLLILILAPQLFLSGVWTPPEAMPWWLRDAMVISPMHFYIDASFGILLKGAGLNLIGHSVASLCALGAIVFAFALWRLRKQFA
jgi:ABC-2 type transport system permease protein